MLTESLPTNLRWGVIPSYAFHRSSQITKSSPRPSTNRIEWKKWVTKVMRSWDGKQETVIKLGIAASSHHHEPKDGMARGWGSLHSQSPRAGTELWERVAYGMCSKLRERYYWPVLEPRRRCSCCQFCRWLQSWARWKNLPYFPLFQVSSFLPMPPIGQSYREASLKGA